MGIGIFSNSHAKPSRLRRKSICMYTYTHVHITCIVELLKMVSFLRQKKKLKEII